MKDRISDFIFISIIGAGIIFAVITAKEMYGGLYGKIAWVALFVLSSIISWIVGKKYNWLFKLLGCYLGILVIFIFIETIILDILDKTPAVVMNILILLIWLLIWYFVFIKNRKKYLKNKED